MLDAIEKEGETVDEALQLIADEFDTDLDNIEYEVVDEGDQDDEDEPSLVLVRGWLKNPDEFEAAQNALVQILEAFELDAEIDLLFDRENTTIYANIESEDAGILIGRQGQTLDSLQYLLQLVVNSKDLNIVLDVANYRERHKAHLVEVAKKMAERVLRSRRRVTLKPMDARDRKIIHEAVKPFPELSSSSVGVEPNRRVVISLKRADYSDRGRRYNQGQGRYNQGRYNRSGNYSR